MPLRMITQCRICKTIRAEEAAGKVLSKGALSKTPLITRIYQSKAYTKGGEPLTKIAKDYTERFSYKGLFLHSKTHQAPTEEDLVEARLKRIHKRTMDDKVAQLIKHADVRQTIMDKGMQQLETGEMKLTSNVLLGAANKEADIEAKQKDQAIEVMKMIQAFQSGEVQYIKPGEELE